MGKKLGAQLKTPEPPDTHPRGPSGAGLRTGVSQSQLASLRRFLLELRRVREREDG